MGDEREVPEVAAPSVEAPVVQRKLVVGAADDPLEADADAVAAQALRRIRNGEVDDGPVAGSDDRARTAGRVQARFERESVGADGGPVGPDTSALIGRARRSGRPLDDSLRRSMESGFGADFSSIRVHHDAAANHASTALQAEAFTSGGDVFFREGAYRPQTESGRELIAHELAHTVQQGAARSVRRHVHPEAHGRLAPMEKPLARAGVIHRTLSAVDPTLGDAKWRLLVGMVEGYNKSPMDAARYAQLDAISTAAKSFADPGFFGSFFAGDRIKAAKAILSQVATERSTLGRAIEERMLKQASTMRANDEFVEKQAKERRDGLKQPGRLDLTKIASGDPGADFGAVADIFTQGRDEMKSSEELIEFEGRTGEAESNLGFMKKKGEVTITVNVPFTGESGHDATIQSALDQYWNVFQAEYKGPITAGSREVKGAKDAKGQALKVKVLEAPPPATGVVDFKFRIGKSSGSATAGGKSPVQDSHDKAGALGASKPVAERFGVKVVDSVFLFTGDHPDYLNRSHLGDGAKTRSDAGNWRMNDAGVERMVAHEFGHLIGLNDEYSQTHADMAQTTGKKSAKYDYDGADKPVLKGADKTDYDKIKAAYVQSGTKAEAVASIAKELKAVYDGDPERFAFLSAHFYEHDSQTIVGAKRHFATGLEAFAKWWEPKTTKAADEAQKRQTNWTGGSVKQRAKMKDAGHGDAHADEAAIKLGAEMKTLVDPDSYDINWMWYSGAGFRSGGLMGDYTTIDSGAEDTRYNAVAHDHKHPLEPRHMKRFVDLLSASRGEKWEVKHK